MTGSECGEEFNVGPVTLVCRRHKSHRQFLFLVQHFGRYGGWKAKWNYNVSKP